MDSTASPSQATDARQPTARECLQALVDAAAKQRAIYALLTQVNRLQQELESGAVRADCAESAALRALGQIARSAPAELLQVSAETAGAIRHAEQVVSALQAEASALVQRAEAEGGAL